MTAQKIFLSILLRNGINRSAEWEKISLWLGGLGGRIRRTCKRAHKKNQPSPKGAYDHAAGASCEKMMLVLPHVFEGVEINDERIETIGVRGI